MIFCEIFQLKKKERKENDKTMSNVRIGITVLLIGTEQPYSILNMVFMMRSASAALTGKKN